MAKEPRNSKRSDDLRPSREDWGHLLSVGSVVGAVLFVLILGAALRGDPTEATSYEAANVVAEPEEWVARELPVAEVPDEASPPAVAPPPDSAPLPTAPPPARSAGDGPGPRSVDDLRRLAATGKPWTAQLAVLCDRDRVKRQIARFGGDDRFHVLPMVLDGRACFRLCWGAFSDPDSARAATGLPAALRELSTKPIPKRTAEVTR